MTVRQKLTEFRPGVFARAGDRVAVEGRAFMFDRGRWVAYDNGPLPACLMPRADDGKEASRCRKTPRSWGWEAGPV